MNPLTLEDLLKFNTFVERVPIDITADGNWIAYNMQNREQYEGGGGNSAYSKTGVMIEMASGTVWVTNTRTGEHRNLTPDWGSSWAPRWSPDGTHLAFFSDRTGKPHLYVWNRETNDMQEFASATVRTFFGFEVPKWTPDGRFVLFKSASSEDIPNFDETVQDESQVSPKTSQETSFVEVWDWPKRQLKQRENEVENGQLQESQHRAKHKKLIVDVVIADTKAGKTFPLMKGYEIRSLDIAPNGEQVAVTVYLGYEAPTSQQPLHDLYVLPLSMALNDVSRTKIEPLVRKIRLGYYGITVSWSPNSRYFAYTTEGDLASGDAYIVDIETGIVRNLTENLDVNLGRRYKPPLWTAEGDALLCIARGQIWKVPLNGNAVRNLTENFEFSAHDVFYPSEGYTPWTVDDAVTIKVYDHKRSCHSYYRLCLKENTVTLLREEDKHRIVHAGRFHQDVAEETGEFIYVVESNQEPPNIWMSDANFESPQQITDINPHLKAIDFGISELIEWKLEDGRTVKGILVLPHEASEKNPAPMIVSVYAGDEPSTQINTFAFGENVGSAHPGMFVSRGYALFLPDFPVPEIEPSKQFSSVVLPGVDAAIATKKVDAERLGVIGHSFGGYTVNVLVTQTTQFKAAVASASIGNLISGYLIEPGAGLSTGWHETGGAGMGGSLWEFPQRYIDGSPVFHLDKVETPLLLIHGDQDFVPFEQAQEMFMGLARLKKEVVLLKYKEADHWPGFWSNEKLADYWERVLNWFSEYLK
ncbi:MAG: prolyl oligopeptidase family serine peptidase [Candidatus Poribacteria bacterium]|nr:prolyl oligopeptidase family serine peptidase [Candidatus Poribacteria bacterium]